MTSPCQEFWIQSRPPKPPPSDTPRYAALDKCLPREPNLNPQQVQNRIAHQQGTLSHLLPVSNHQVQLATATTGLARTHFGASSTHSGDPDLIGGACDEILGCVVCYWLTEDLRFLAQGIERAEAMTSRLFRDGRTPWAVRPHLERLPLSGLSHGSSG